LVFKEPYFSNYNNSFADENREFIERALYHDVKLHAKVANAKRIFMEQKITLIYGDFHTGSIMVLDVEKRMQILNYEFAMLGPLSYDLGNLLAHLTRLRDSI
jgi:5-methylthioribose kinase